MNREKAQQEITKIVETYREANGKAARNQYTASKKYIARAQELGILDMIPNAPYARHIGNTEIQLVIKAAEDSGHAVGGFNAYGEGDVIDTKASALYQAINEANEKPDFHAMFQTLVAEKRSQPRQSYARFTFIESPETDEDYQIWLDEIDAD